MARTSDGLEEVRQIVADTIARHKLIYPGERVLVGFSGGADSTALALILRDLGYEIVLGHVDHGLRNESRMEAEQLGGVAQSLRIPFLTRRVQVIPPTEERARAERYGALQEMARESGCSVIATGHTFDDQAETVAMRKLRGGFALGMPHRRGNIVRPLLDIRRSDTEAVCRDAGVEFLTDPSNSLPQYMRNRIRAELREKGDDAIVGLVREGDENRFRVDATRRDALEFLEEFSSLGWPTAIDRRALIALDEGVREQVLREAARHYGVELRAAAVDDVVSKVLTTTGSGLDLAPNLKVWAEKDEVMVGPPLRVEKPHRLPLTLVLDGEATDPTGSWAYLFRTQLVSRPSAFDPSPFVEYFDADALSEPLVIKQWRAGDRFHPLGAPGTKKLQDFFVDIGLPATARHDIPILESAGRIAWVIPFRIDERFKVTSGSAKAVRVEVASTSERSRG